MNTKLHRHLVGQVFIRQECGTIIPRQKKIRVLTTTKDEFGTIWVTVQPTECSQPWRICTVRLDNLLNEKRYRKEGE